jgi:integrase
MCLSIAVFGHDPLRIVPLGIVKVQRNGPGLVSLPYAASQVEPSPEHGKKEEIPTQSIALCGMARARVEEPSAEADAGRAGHGGLAVSSIRVHLAAIKTAHLLAGLSLDLRHPRLAMVIEGVTRATGVRPRRKVAPAVPDVLRRMLAARPREETPLGARDRAMLLLGFGAALRRSELVALTLGDVEPVPGRGILLTITRSKTDPHGAGQRVAVHANPTEPGCCPAAALAAWLRHRHAAPDLDWTASASVRAERPLFCAVSKKRKVTGEKLSDKAIARLVKLAAAEAGLDAERYSGHSLRRGLLTAGADNRAHLAELMRQSRHRSAQSVLGYLEPAHLWRNNVTDGVFGRPAAGGGRGGGDSGLNRALAGFRAIKRHRRHDRRPHGAAIRGRPVATTGPADWPRDRGQGDATRPRGCARVARLHRPQSRSVGR